MYDQVVIEDKASQDDFDASMSERKIGEPVKKAIKESVPFSNVTYDFTNINGEPYWEERPLEYIFEILADTPEELEQKKKRFSNWIMLVHQQKLYDPFIKDYHFVATFDSMDCDDSEIDKSTITVKFSAYPFKVSNEKKVYENNILSGDEIAIEIENDSSHIIIPTIETSSDITIKMDNATYGLSAGKIESENLEFKPGIINMTIKNTSDIDSVVAISFSEEVL